ncbi:iron-hydroxamate ABC transporter substrate-binding protein [Paenibacillus sp. EKM211P]|uniref:iron-hydroxamate ABC transporter substrate-binding protein n=1 Tax=Paenibacillus sp. EKM211P TaxID=1683679 RepID=UPI0013E907C0|nr:iron-hydroxamate ABC transporter substrate-binding protein [Paenibacillus sp. EKM211P]KAF6582357.1 iron-hydroxamate ABC transporter substrate-binding protein [Paenibacillus sp. EKM211P]
MKKFAVWMCTLLSASLLLTACGGKVQEVDSSAQKNTNASTQTSVSDVGSAKTITYLDKTYKLAKTDHIIIASLEAMEDAAVLGVKPTGAVTSGGKFPEFMEKAMEGAADVGDRMQPSAETILKLKADVILGSSKFRPAVAEQLGKVAPLVPVSHISTNWEANLLMLGQLTGKEAKAKEILDKYKQDAEAAQQKLKPIWGNKKVLMVRIRTGNLYVYPADVYFNPSLYADLGAKVPEELNTVKAQEAVSLEKLADMNPDYLFVQFSEGENKDQPQALADLEKNPIWSSINAVKNGKTFVNIVDPNAQGGTSWSKLAFLEAVMNRLSQ